MQSFIRSLRAWLLACILGCCGFGSVAQGQTLIWPGERVAEIEAEHLTAYVPYAQRQELKPLVARADVIWAQMCADAGFVPSRKLYVLFGDWVDDHNGYSFVAPFPLVQVELAPARPESTIHNGAAERERTLVHEFAHSISNDRNQGIRRVLERIFGRVLPVDPLSLLVWYLSTPAHQTMPRFWHEGLATWAETEYADPTGVWAGRGRDALTHMVWRLDAAEERTPQVSDWRITQHRWPFGSVVYTYGVAYTRYLSSKFAERADVWDFVRWQAFNWPFVFNSGPARGGKARHAELLREARLELLREQNAQLATLRSVPVTDLQRLTPTDTIVAAPTWRADGTLEYAAHDVWGRARLHRLDPTGRIRSSGRPTRALGNMRRTEDGQLVYQEFNWRRRSHVRVGRHRFGPRLIEPDATCVDGHLGWLASVRLAGAGRQELVVWELDFRKGRRSGERVLDTQGRPWSPAFRDSHPRELAWVETDATGSKLMLGRIDTDERRVLYVARGRIMHPVWNSAGERLYFCSDQSGVANAYVLIFDAIGDTPRLLPITNTLGGVTACVPSPDGSQLALVEHDSHGPFLAKGSADPAQWIREVPHIELHWPAPVVEQEGLRAARPELSTGGEREHVLPALEGESGADLTARSYRGLPSLRPLFWSPTSLAVPEGGFGITGLMADPLFTHLLQSGLGVGLNEAEPVGFLDYAWLGWPIEFGAHVRRAERTFNDVIVADTREEFDYSETVESAEVRAGRSLFGLEHRFRFYAALGASDSEVVPEAREEYEGETLVNLAPFEGTERYTEFVVGWSNTTLYPTSFAPEDGFNIAGLYRNSGYGGDIDRDLGLLDASYTASIWPRGGHQLVLRAQVGWSEGDDSLQSNFSIGGGLSRGLPRGYLVEAEAAGRHLLAGSLAYRFPLWRPFQGFGTSPFRHRQLALELFTDTAKVSGNAIDGDGVWFWSTGLEVHSGWEVADLLIQPGLGLAVQLDGGEDVEVYFSLGFGF